MYRLNDDDDGAAKVDVVEATTEPTEYQHPNNKMISFVDLPGIGTPNYPDLQTYCEKVGLKEYDTFLIFTANRFTQNDLELAKKVKSIGKSFFLIRTKIDVDCTPKAGKRINEADILEKIRQYCIQHVKDLISSEKEIFLISNYHKEKWDFDRLLAAISDALPVVQKECLTLSLSNVTRECLKRKAKFFKGKDCFNFIYMSNYMHLVQRTNGKVKLTFRLFIGRIFRTTKYFNKILNKCNFKDG